MGYRYNYQRGGKFLGHPALRNPRCGGCFLGLLFLDVRLGLRGRLENFLLAISTGVRSRAGANVILQQG